MYIDACTNNSRTVGNVNCPDLFELEAEKIASNHVMGSK